MARLNPNAVLFGTGDDDADDITGFDALVEAAEATETTVDAGEEVDLALDAGDDAETGHDDPEDEEATDGDTEVDDEADDDTENDAHEDESTEEVDQPAKRQLKFKSQTAAEEAYEELRVDFNRRVLAMEAAQRAQPQPVAAPAAPEPAPDTPVERFNWALQQGNDLVARQTIARVQANSTQMSAQAALARADGEEDAAQEFDNRSVEAAMMADEMREVRSRAQYEAAVQQQVAPIQEDRFRQSLTQAASKAMTQGALGMVDTTPYEESIGQFVQANPQIMGQWSPQEMEAGFAYAATEVVFGGQQAMIDWIVDQRVAEAKAAPPAPKPKARGTAGGSGRRSTAPAVGSDDADDDEIRASVSNIPSNGMNVLFNN